MTLITAHLAASSILASMRRIDSPHRLEKKPVQLYETKQAPAAPLYVASLAQVLPAISSAMNNNEAPRND